MYFHVTAAPIRFIRMTFLMRKVMYTIAYLELNIYRCRYIFGVSIFGGYNLHYFS